MAVANNYRLTHIDELCFDIVLTTESGSLVPRLTSGVTKNLPALLFPLFRSWTDVANVPVEFVVWGHIARADNKPQLSDVRKPAIDLAPGAYL